MKKTLVALAVAAAAVAGSASAAVVYNQDGTKVELGGSVRIWLGNNADERTDLKNDGSRITLKASQDLGNGLSAFTGYDLRFNNAANTHDDQDTSSSNFGDPSTKRLFVGLKHDDVGALSFGRQATTASDVLQDGAYYRSGEYGQLTGDADKSVKFRSADFGGFSFGVDYLFGHENTKTAGEVDAETAATLTTGKEFKNGFGLSGFYHFDFAEDQKFEVAAGYTQNNFNTDEISLSTNSRAKAWLLHGSYTIGPVYFAANYGQSKEATDYQIGDEKSRYTLIDVQYQVAEPTKVWFQWERADKRTDDIAYNQEIKNRYQVGADYQINDKIVTYALFERERIQTQDSTSVDKTFNNYYGVGLQVFF